MTTWWREKKVKRKAFTGLRMSQNVVALLFRLGPIDVNWKQPQWSCARESVIFWGLLELDNNIADRNIFLSSSCTREVKIASIKERNQRSTLVDYDWYSTWREIDSEQQKCRRCCLMSKYCCDLKWNYDCNTFDSAGVYRAAKGGKHVYAVFQN